MMKPYQNRLNELMKNPLIQKIDDLLNDEYITQHYSSDDMIGFDSFVIEYLSLSIISLTDDDHQ